jgi:hypothetical protein
MPSDRAQQWPARSDPPIEEAQRRFARAVRAEATYLRELLRKQGRPHPRAVTRSPSTVSVMRTTRE